MRRQRSGLLIHVSSGAGRVTVPALAAYCASKYALEAIADSYRYELLPFGVDSILVEPGVYRTGIHDRWIYPADTARLADYGGKAEFAQRVDHVFQGIVDAPDAPGSSEVVDTLAALIDMAPEQRPFRTVVSAPIQQLLDAYNVSADALRPIVAQIFDVAEFAGSPRTDCRGAHDLISSQAMEPSIVAATAFRTQMSCAIVVTFVLFVVQVSSHSP
jgi:NAD(P)-dependent dehydrogenase (short-subunit alcohol dehydrogenase family)